MALSTALVTSCRGDNQAETALRFSARVAPPAQAAQGIQDVAVTLEHCRDTEAALRKRWGVPREIGDDVVRWADRDTKWVADLIQNGAECQLRFTTARFFGETGHPPRVLAGIQTGATREEVRRLIPALADTKAVIDLAGIAGASQGITFDPSSDRVEDVYLVLPSRAVEALEMAWGSGPTWNDPTTSTAARLEPPILDDSVLRFHHYTPLEEWLGDGTSLAVLPGDLWKVDFPAFARAHPNLHPDLERPYTITLPATESSPFDGIVADLTLDTAKNVVRVSFALPYRSAQMRDRIVAQLERKWGTHTATGEAWTFERNPNVTVNDQLGQLIVHVESGTRHGVGTRP